MSCKTKSRDADLVSSQDSSCWSFLKKQQAPQKHAIKIMELAVELATSSPFPVPCSPFLLFAPLAGTAQATLQEGTGESPMPCDIAANTLPLSSWLERAIGQGSRGPWAFLCGKILSACCPLPFLQKAT